MRSSSTCRRLRDRNFPVVLLVGIEGSGIDAVGIDEYAGAYDATRHLIDEGHRRIGALVTPQYQTNRKYSGYRRRTGLRRDWRAIPGCRRLAPITRSGAASRRWTS